MLYYIVYIGDYESAIETLKMAITLIKQSITAGSESCQVEECVIERERDEIQIILCSYEYSIVSRY